MTDAIDSMERIAQKGNKKMEITYKDHMESLWELTGVIGTLGEKDERYCEIYLKLSEALDIAEEIGLITYREEEQ